MRLLAITLVAFGLNATPLAAAPNDVSATDDASTAPATPVPGEATPAAVDAPPADATEQAPEEQVEDAPTDDATTPDDGSTTDDVSTTDDGSTTDDVSPTSGAEAEVGADMNATIDETVVEVEEQEEAAAPADDVDSDEPSLLERQIVAFVASGVSVSSLAVGIVVGFLAWQQFNCLQNVLTCNETLAEPIRGADYFTARSNVEHLALIADMAYLFAGAAAIVAITGFIRGFWLTGESDAEEAGEEVPATSSRPHKPSGLARSTPGLFDTRGAE